MKALGIWLTLLSAVAGAQEALRWDVPLATSRVEVAGEVVAQGMPMKLTVATTALAPDEAIAHYARVFAASGFFIPPARSQVRVQGALQLSALDVDRLYSYQVLARPLAGNRGTQLLLSVASVDEDVRPAPLVVPYPGATSVLTTEAEGSQTLSYLSAASASQLEAFHTEGLAKAGYRRGPQGVFLRSNEALSLTVRALPDGRAAVLIKAVAGQGAETISASMNPP